MRAVIVMLLAMCGALAPGLSGCASGGRVSGAAFFDTRVVRVGEIVDVRIPFNRQGGVEWDVESYDSLYLGFVARSLQMQSEDEGTMLVQFRAKTPGETTLTLGRRYSTGAGQSTVESYTINILAP